MGQAEVPDIGPILQRLGAQRARKCNVARFRCLVGREVKGVVISDKSKLPQTVLEYSRKLRIVDKLPAIPQTRFFAFHVPHSQLYETLFACFNTDDRHDQGLVHRLYP